MNDMFKKYNKTKKDLYYSSSTCKCSLNNHKFMNITNYTMKEFGVEDYKGPDCGYTVCWDCGQFFVEKLMYYVH